MSQCEKFGYMIYQVGDRLMRVYCKPPDKRVLGDATPGQQPEAYVGIQPGVDPRYEMSTWDNLERDRNRTKAMMRLVMSKSQPLDSDTKKTVNKIIRDATLTLIEERTGYERKQFSPEALANQAKFEAYMRSDARKMAILAGKRLDKSYNPESMSYKDNALWHSMGLMHNMNACPRCQKGEEFKSSSFYRTQRELLEEHYQKTGRILEP